MLINIYKNSSPFYIILTSWLLIVLAMIARFLQGLDVPLINGLFILVGLVVYFLPTLIIGEESGARLRRKLLWLLVLAGILIFAGELIRFFTTSG